jgi:NhaA family Na+:H+ antiporter
MTAKAPTAAPYTVDNTDLYGGIALGIAAAAALIVANSPLGSQYQALLHTTGEDRIDRTEQDARTLDQRTA